METTGVDVSESPQAKRSDTIADDSGDMVCKLTTGIPMCQCENFGQGQRKEPLGLSCVFRED